MQQCMNLHTHYASKTVIEPASHRSSGKQVSNSRVAQGVHIIDIQGLYNIYGKLIDKVYMLGATCMPCSTPL